MGAGGFVEGGERKYTGRHEPTNGQSGGKIRTWGPQLYTESVRYFTETSTVTEGESEMERVGENSANDNDLKTLRQKSLEEVGDTEGTGKETSGLHSFIEGFWTDPSVKSRMEMCL